MPAEKAPASTSRLIARVLRSVLAENDDFESLADLIDALKYRLARLRLKYTPEDLFGALELVGSNRALVTLVAAVAPMPPPDVPAMTHDEAVRILESLGVVVKHA